MGTYRPKEDTEVREKKALGKKYKTSPMATWMVCMC